MDIRRHSVRPVCLVGKCGDGLRGAGCCCCYCLKWTMWSSVVPDGPQGSAPSARAKHSATIVAENVYVLGGRNGNVPLKDFWRYNLGERFLICIHTC